MKQRIPAKTVEVCDFCQREGYLQTCKACGKRYCLTDNGIITGCVHGLDICKRCADVDAVVKIAEKYAPKILAVLKARDVELNALSEKGLQHGDK